MMAGICLFFSVHVVFMEFFVVELSNEWVMGMCAHFSFNLKLMSLYVCIL